ncbi:MAG: DNA-directed RNA polymerase subunit H [Methanotrichaceae archaeon]|nr:DNA-directed RNA polymerase subunit H [Methanotrichaceae archaeon]
MLLFLEVVGVTATKFSVKDHELVPEHILLSPEESGEVLRKYGVDAAQLPKIHVNDPVAKEIGANVGDIIKIIRKSPTAKHSIFYRLVID